MSSVFPTRRSADRRNLSDRCNSARPRLRWRDRRRRKRAGPVLPPLPPPSRLAAGRARRGAATAATSFGVRRRHDALGRGGEAFDQVDLGLAIGLDVGVENFVETDCRPVIGIGLFRSEERRVGRESASTCRSRVSPYSEKQKKKQNNK